MTQWGQVGVGLQGPRWQQSSLGIPWQPQPWLLGARRSSSCGLARTGAETCGSIPAEAAARRALQSLAWALVEMAGEGWAPTALGHG